VNTAPREALIRVPGLGLRNVERILRARRHRALRIADLARLRVALRRAAPFLVTADGAGVARALDDAGLRARVQGPQQLSLFDATAGAASGEL
jgi:predicted DNA-binding helix-hairpin-helix protein